MSDIKEKLFEEYLPKFKALEYKEFAEEILEKDSNYRDVGTIKGLEHLYNELDKEVPQFSNREEIIINLLRIYLNGNLKNKKRTYNIIDWKMTLYLSPYLNKLKNEWQIKQLIPNLKDIIRSVVKDEIKNI